MSEPRPPQTEGGEHSPPESPPSDTGRTKTGGGEDRDGGQEHQGGMIGEGERRDPGGMAGEG